MHEMRAELSMPQDAYEGIKENQDPSLLPLAHCDMLKVLHLTDTGRLSWKSSSDNASLEGIRLHLKEVYEIDNKIVSRNDFEDITKVEADIHISQLLNTLTDMDQDQAHENWRLISGHSGKVRKNDLKDPKLLDGAPQAKIQHQNLVNGEVAVGGARENKKAIDNIPMHLKVKAPKETPRRHSRVRRQGQEIPSKPENNSKKTEELKQSRERVKTEEKPIIPKTKRKRNPPELSHNFEKLRTPCGMHMLNSMLVFH